MTLVIPPTYYVQRFEFEAVNAANVAACSIGLHYTGADFATDAANADTAWITNMMPVISIAWRLSAISWHVADGTVRAQPYDVEGGDTASPMPPNVAYLLRKGTAMPGRSQRGRMYLPGVSEPSVDGTGNVLMAKITAIAAGVQGWGVARNAAHFIPHLLHGPNKAGVQPAPTQITTISCDNLVATQRRRLRR